MLLTANGTKASHVDSVIRYVKSERGVRLRAIYFEDETLKLGPRGARSADTIIMHSVNGETWKRLRDVLEEEKVEILDFEGLSVAGDRLPGSMGPIDPT